MPDARYLCIACGEPRFGDPWFLDPSARELDKHLTDSYCWNCIKAVLASKFYGLWTPEIVSALRKLAD